MSNTKSKAEVNEVLAKPLLYLSMVDEKFIEECVKNHVEIDKNSYGFEYVYEITSPYKHSEIIYRASVGGIEWEVRYDPKSNDYKFMMLFPECPIDMTEDGGSVKAYTKIYIRVLTIPQVLATYIAKNIMAKKEKENSADEDLHLTKTSNTL